MTNPTKFIGTFMVTGYQYRMYNPDSYEITKIPFKRKIVISIYDQTKNGTILKKDSYDEKGNLRSIQLGHIQTLTNKCGKKLTQYLEFVDNNDNGVITMNIKKRDKKGYVTEYSFNSLEAGFAVNNPNQQPLINLSIAERIKE